MIGSAFKIALDPYFRVKEENPANKKWSYKGHFKNNKFYLTFEQELKQRYRRDKNQFMLFPTPFLIA